MDLVAVARDLYGLPPEEFTAARTVRVREARDAGDRRLADAIGRLPRPSAAAGAVDHLVREAPQVVHDALTVGRRMATAQVSRSGEELRALRREQQAVLGRVREALAGRRLSPAVLAQVESTVHAAMADPAAAEAVTTGLLVTDLTASGFEPVDVSGAVAVPGAPPLLDVPEPGPPGKPPVAPPAHVAPEASTTADPAEGAGAAADQERRRRAGEAAAARAAADRALDRARAAALAAEGRLTDDAAELDRLDAEVRRLEAELVRVRSERGTARGAVDEARRAARSAARDLRAASRAAEAAHAADPTAEDLDGDAHPSG